MYYLRDQGTKKFEFQSKIKHPGQRFVFENSVFNFSFFLPIFDE